MSKRSKVPEGLRAVLRDLQTSELRALQSNAGEGKQPHEKLASREWCALRGELGARAQWGVQAKGENMKQTGLVYKSVSLESVAPDRYRFIASDGGLDRYGDMVRVDGWDLSAYRENPIVLWGHNHDVVLGLAEVEIEGSRLVAEVELKPIGERALSVAELVRSNIVRAVSVGFRPTVEPMRLEMGGGYEYRAQELLELSIVAVPANPRALRLDHATARA